MSCLQPVLRRQLSASLSSTGSLRINISVFAPATARKPTLVCAPTPPLCAVSASVHEWPAPVEQHLPVAVPVAAPAPPSVASLRRPQPPAKRRQAHPADAGNVTLTRSNAIKRAGRKSA